MAAAWVELRHESTGAVHKFPARTVDAWAAKGWHPFEAPPPEKPKAVRPAKSTSAAPAAPDKEDTP